MSAAKSEVPKKGRKAGPAKARSPAVILDFLRELRSHNDRVWFEANRPRYEEAREAFLELVGDLIGRFGPVDDLAGVSVGECVFRINRDVRFSNDKSPYKTVMSALLGPNGRKSTGRTYYFHIEPDGQSFLAGGIHSPSSEELGKMRMALAEDSGRLRKILKAPAFVQHFGGLSGEALKTAPQGYAKDHPAIDLLRMKQFLAMHPLEDELLLSEDLVPHALVVFKAMKPFLSYLEKTLA